MNTYDLFKIFDEFKTILTTMQVVTDDINNLFQIFRTQFASEHCNAVCLQILRRQFLTENIKSSHNIETISVCYGIKYILWQLRCKHHILETDSF